MDNCWLWTPIFASTLLKVFQKSLNFKRIIFTSMEHCLSRTLPISYQLWYLKEVFGIETIWSWNLATNTLVVRIYLLLWKNSYFHGGSECSTCKVLMCKCQNCVVSAAKLGRRAHRVAFKGFGRSWEGMSESDKKGYKSQFRGLQVLLGLE